jgi:hypothetical protein
MPMAEAIWLGKYSGAAAAMKDLKLSSDSTRVQIQIHLKKIRSSEALQAATVAKQRRATDEADADTPRGTSPTGGATHTAPHAPACDATPTRTGYRECGGPTMYRPWAAHRWHSPWWVTWGVSCVYGPYGLDVHGVSDETACTFYAHMQDGVYLYRL